MKRIRTTDIEYYAGEQIIIPCWIHGVRELKNLTFVIMRDGWGTAQALSDNSRICERIKSIPVGSAVEMLGTVQKNSHAHGGFELMLEGIRYQGEPDGELISGIDISKKELNMSPATMLDHAARVLRRPEIRFRHRLASLSQRLFREFLDAEGFTEIRTPKITSTGMEGGSTVFQLDYFGKKAFLAQSPQLYKQQMVGVFQKVYEIGPVFRAEKHTTVRHLNEYTSMDVEMGFIRNHRDLMDLLERLIAFLSGRSAELVMEWAERFPVHWPTVPRRIPVVDFEKALEIASRQGVANSGLDLSPEAERVLGEWCLTEFSSDFLFVSGYPMEVRPFYTAPDPDRPGYSMSFDLLFRGQELVTGGQRLHRGGDYREAMKRSGMDTQAFSSYLESFDAGMPPHGGFGLGLERWIQMLLNLPNIRQASLFPRDMGRLIP
ncbi:aspartate--tRNA(Asn) ligase [Salinispira pacifica]|uniref:Aspartyl-tRNA synthetase n=1 Tax=Salinispira pacifica TaxID=1307761 RepID=V5WNQ2_9SPIO|nr:aspartate--tRNA(Asn) ligase [Salinispira pacifica]AHC16676.1 Aspartyl-tRNA synthetase [Salinispira pacifica]